MKRLHKNLADGRGHNCGKQDMVNMINQFWKDKEVLITGYEGFLGSHLTRTLLNFGARIWGLDIVVHRKKTILSDGELNRVRIIKGSVTNFSLVSEIIKEGKIELIFHLAAETLVGKSLRKPLKTFSTNIKGTWQILEASKVSNTIKGIIVASSDKAYGDHKKLPYKEDTSLSGAHPYDVSKSCADLLSYMYFYTYGLPVCVTRCGNIFGPGDFNFSRIVPDTIRSIIMDKSLIIRSDGKFTRDYVYVTDVVNGYILLAEKMQKLKLFGEAFNFSDGDAISVLELVRKIYDISGNKPNYRIIGTAKCEIRHQHLSPKKARKVLSWKPSYTKQEGLKNALQWYREYFQDGKR